MISLNCKGRILKLDAPKVMGILNITSDSFFDGGAYLEMDAILQRVQEMVDEGVAIVDVGGMSSRPGAEIINAEEEAQKVVPVIRAINNRFPDIIISIDTVHSTVAQQAIDAGARMINDISGGNIDAEIWNVCKHNSVPYVLMHMQGVPNMMQNNPKYDDVTLDILTYLRDKVYELQTLGIKDVIIDPGFGFGKTIEQNYELLDKLSSFKILDCAILVGISRKSMIYKLLDSTPKEALNGTTATHMVALQNGANILRVHDVREAKECIEIFRQLKKSRS